MFKRATEFVFCSIKKLFYKIRYGKRLSIGRKVVFREGFRINMGKHSKLFIGDGTFFNRFCTINCRNFIKIGCNNIFGEFVTLYDHNHIFNETLFNKKAIKNGQILIGNENWICSKATICSNSIIGNRCVVAANVNYSNKKLENYSLYLSNGLKKDIVVKQ